MTYVAFEMPVGTRECHCTVCGLLFLSGDAFDVHRGIDKNLESIGDYDDLRQDLGRCLTTNEFAKVGLQKRYDNHTGYRYGLQPDIDLAEKMQIARENRSK